MTTPDEDDDLLAGEYALGSLDPAERQAANRRRASDAGFDSSVQQWEERLSPLYETGRDVEPPAHLWGAILAQIRAIGGQPPRASVVDLRPQVRRWQTATAAALSLAAALALWIAIGPTVAPPRPGATFVAVLQKSPDLPAFLMKADLRDRALAVQTVSAPPVPDKSYELWIIDPSLGAPKSLGVVGGDRQPRPLPDVPQDVLSRATYAITVEQPGGAPDGKPSGPPVFFGHLLKTGA